MKSFYDGFASELNTAVQTVPNLVKIMQKNLAEDPNTASKEATGEFITETGGLVKSCVVNLIPVQAGTGTPSPDNVRSISGHTDVILAVKDGDDATQQTYEVQIGSTVYGGYVDLVSGVLVVDKICETINSVTAIWQEGGHSFRAFVSNAHTQPTSGTSVDAFGMSNRLSQASGTETYQSAKDFTFSIDQNATRVSLCFDKTINTVELANQYLTENSVQICYELATPQTIQLTPQQIEALKGINKFVCTEDGQSVDKIVYQQIFDFDDVKAYSNNAISAAVSDILPADPESDGTYTLKLIKSGTTITKEWTADTP